MAKRTARGTRPPSPGWFLACSGHLPLRLSAGTFGTVGAEGQEAVEQADHATCRAANDGKGLKCGERAAGQADPRPAAAATGPLARLRRHHGRVSTTVSVA